MLLLCGGVRLLDNNIDKSWVGADGRSIEE